MPCLEDHVRMTLTITNNCNARIKNVRKRKMHGVTRSVKDSEGNSDQQVGLQSNQEPSWETGAAERNQRATRVLRIGRVPGTRDHSGDIH